MIDNIDGNNRALEEAIKNAEQAKARLANERKKQNERRRKAENRHKYMMGGIIVKYFPPPVLPLRGKRAGPNTVCRACHKGMPAGN